MEKTSGNQHQSDFSRAAADHVVQHKEDDGMASEFINNRPDALALKQLRETMHSSPQAKAAAQLMAKINNSPYLVKKNQLMVNAPNAVQQIEKEELPQGRVRPTMQMKNGIPINDDQELEQEANVMGRQTVQRVLNTSEQDDKLRILRDYVQFTPPNHAPFLNEYGSPPKDKIQYKLKLLEKICSSKHIMHSLKSKTTMAADEQDDNWSEGSFNVNTLITAINDIYNHNLSRKDGTRLIGRTDDDFAHHDCVWAAVAYGLGRENSLEVERAIAAEHSSREGEVEDSILYRIMENLGWTFLGQGTFATMFPALRPGVATTTNVRNSHNGRYIISEDIDTGGTQGHVFAVDVLDHDDAGAPLGYSRSITFTDRQHERAHHDATRVNPPAFQVYVWKVTD